MRRLVRNWNNQLLLNATTGKGQCLASRGASGQPAKAEAVDPDNNGFGSKYCMGLVEKYDYENYLSTLLLPRELRRAAFALRAFNVEVSRSVSGHQVEPQIAKLRLKFWYDSIDKCFERESQQSYVKDQPVLRELKYAVGTRKLNKIYLRRLVTARERPPNQGFESLRELEEYAEQTFSSLLHLLVEVSGAKDLQVDHAASHLGKAQGIATLLRAIPHAGRQQAVCVPLEVLVRHGVSQERILRSKSDDKGVEECIFEVASAANTHLKLAQQLHDQVPRPVRKIFLSAVATEGYLERLRRADFLLTHKSCVGRDTMLPARLFWKSLLNRY
ncbi:NADH dehydrogenase (ubiquinone) complex I, assembly factor 6 homolog [Drosophila guanche]|uniref:Blast:NADH dehydrogenase (Ubiquinone) complex I, assembly factor 6 homolog n=1 Tax=Drosophila guanche TaxID=7266 RepID=A0A3B0K7V1_DROGU|nr:NADH dehydrogenase (ubiquinone) complex I, assembly factor 6 homolog [Drosophila guanche]SPP88742.1 blast:NADH dehydrogenase (ubiquinone) complex I%2C assembly factor 6 homolog [Drosophila guanche]